jgi:DNA mismatch repair protein MutS
VTKDATVQTLEAIMQSGTKLTPMMDQYYQIKLLHPGILMMFRMGDFYEVFFDDAKEASRLLNISLTHRGKLGDHPIPMAGIPHHAASAYIDRLTSLGMKVAICEQVEDPKEAKGIVKRAVTQVVSPGMPYDLDKSSELEHSFMACLYEVKDATYLIFVDYTTGEFFGLQTKNSEEALEKLALYRPKEIITYLGQWDDQSPLHDYIEKAGILKTHLSLDYFTEKYTNLYVEKLIPTYKRDEVLKLHPEVLRPIGALAYYICSTQSLENLTHFRPFRMINTQADMKITYPTLVGLEIFPKSKESYKDSILGFMDHTQTALGTRKLKSLFQAPLRDKEQIQNRHATIDYFIANTELLKTIRDDLSYIRDIERIMAKVSTGKVTGGDLINLSRAYQYFTKILGPLNKLPKNIIPAFSKKEMEALAELTKKIDDTINDEIGAHLEKGNLIKTGCSKERDKLWKLTNNAADALIELETRYREQTGINNLKVKYNNIAGYFIEVSKSHTKKVPKDFMRRQTLVNSERYQSEELAEFEKEMLSAKDKLSKLERKIFDDLVNHTIELAKELQKLADAIALLDVFQSLAWVAYQEDFIKPLILENNKLLKVKQAWHPLIKAAIKDQFVKHDLTLSDEKYFGLITGPNMAGKTTVMREMAIIQFLAQLGSFVPAQSAEIGLCDYLFSRLGASDDIIKGQSTFMVEMSETAQILRHATENSLIILDEIGRGTSTYDGLSIAWSLVEYFVNKTRALTLFSTHYHELIDLVETLPAAKNLTVKTVSEKGNVQFLYKLIEAGAGQSFGIHVAKLAGLPKEILNRSGQILATLEKNHNHASDVLKKNTDQLDLFKNTPEIIFEEANSPIIQELEKLDVMNMTPMQAMQKLYELKQALH